MQFQRGSTKIFSKTSFDESIQEEFLKRETAKRVFNASVPFSRITTKGVSSAKKTDIVSKLCLLMPENRQQFWNMLPKSESATLSDCFGINFVGKMVSKQLKMIGVTCYCMYLVQSHEFTN